MALYCERKTNRWICHGVTFLKEEEKSKEHSTAHVTITAFKFQRTVEVFIRSGVATVQKHFLTNFYQKKLFQIHIFLSCKSVLISVKISAV